MGKSLVELFVKASVIDAQEKGACPLSQKWFMVFYILVEKQTINLRVIPVSMATPPPEYEKLQVAHRLPAVAVYDSSESITRQESQNASEVFAGNDELEEMIRKSFSQYVNVDTEVQWVGCNLLRNLNSFLRSGQAKSLLADLFELDQYISKLQTAYLESDEIAYSDCAIASKLQHVRVTGEFYHQFTIPYELRALWSYLARVYETPCFKVSSPSDRDILLHYLDKIAPDESSSSRLAIKRRILGISEDQRCLQIPAPSAMYGLKNSRQEDLRFTVRSALPAVNFDAEIAHQIASRAAETFVSRFL